MLRAALLFSEPRDSEKQMERWQKKSGDGTARREFGKEKKGGIEIEDVPHIGKRTDSGEFESRFILKAHYG